MPPPKPKRRRQKPSRVPQILIICGVILLVILVLIFKNDRDSTVRSLANDEELPAEQLDHALAENRPALAFFHSNNCHQCVVMMETVEQVYPEFRGSVTLIDVNVYDEQNTQLLKEVGLRFIPTLIFYDRSGQEQVSIGVIEPEQLRQVLASMVEGK